MSNDYVRFIGRPPSIFYRWGLFSLFVLFLASILVSLVMEVPKKVKAPADVTAAEASSPIVANHTGLVDAVHCTEGSYVNEGDLLFRLASEADYNDVLSLETWLNTLDSSGNRSPLPKQLSLGSDQLSEAYMKLRRLVDLTAFGQDSLGMALHKQGIEEQISALEGVSRQIKRQQSLCYDVLESLNDQLADWEARLAQGLVSEREVETYRIQVKEKRETCARFSRSLEDNKALIEGLRREITDLEVNDLTTKAEDKTEELLACENLRVAINAWKERYLISAKTSGLLTLSNEDLMGSALSKDQVIGEILQDGASAQVYAFIPVSSIDEVRIGQEVQVIIEGFSLREYGKLEGSVTAIRPTLEEDKMHQRIEISLKNGLTTSKGKAIEYRPSYRAEAIIVTERTPILFRLLDELRES